VGEVHGGVLTHIGPVGRLCSTHTQIQTGPKSPGEEEEEGNLR
jgi:hypothetical protein